MATVYMTVDGRQKDTSAAIDASAAVFGVESSKNWLADYTPEFVDFPFTDPEATFDEHLGVVKATRPTVTVAPDIERGREPATVYAQADRLADYADAVVIVPKAIHPAEVPERFRIGVTLADFGSTAPWGVWDYRGCGPVHLLGGGPARQLTTGEHLQVASLDTAALGKTARFGYWDGKTRDAPNAWDYRLRLEASLNNYAERWTAE